MLFIFKLRLLLSLLTLMKIKCFKSFYNLLKRELIKRVLLRVKKINEKFNFKNSSVDFFKTIIFCHYIFYNI